MNEVLDTLIAWLGTEHTQACNEKSARYVEQGFTPLCSCDFWKRLNADLKSEIGMRRAE